MTLNYKKICLWAMVISYPFVLCLAAGLFFVMLLTLPYTYSPGSDDEPIGEVEACDLMPSGTVNGHDYVDLGLSVKWATCNVGASEPKDGGNDYAWGETGTKASYTKENCSTYARHLGDINATSLDVARTEWGSPWRMPTEAECEELFYNCVWTWGELGGTLGCMVTSMKNGNTVFLPADTWMDHNNDTYLCGAYWSSTPFSDDDAHAVNIHFTKHGVTATKNSRDYRYKSMKVRPVTAK